jgi:lysozyme
MRQLLSTRAIMNITNKQRGLVAIIGAVATAGVFMLTPRWEGTVATTYKDMGGVLTYCTGATENAIWGKTYTPAECRAQLDRDLARHAEGMMACLKVPTTDGQRIAFTDVTYNIGVAAFCGSSMARKTNAGDARAGCNSLLLWNKVGGSEVRGLTLRRQAEREICLRGLP